MIWRNNPQRFSHLFRLSLLGLLLFSTINWAENTSLTKTKSQLKRLDSQIKNLKLTLASANDKRGMLNKELAGTEKQISEGIRHLRQIQQGISIKQQKINSLQRRVDELNEQLLAQQKLLAEHIRIRYKMGEYQPLKWLLNQDDPYSISRLLTFHQYIVHSRQNIIDAIDTTKQNLTFIQNGIKKELNAQQKLEKQLHNHQLALEHNKQYNKTVIQSLNSEIQTKQITLSEYERNKENLSLLLQTLAAESIIQAKQPFTQMKRKLPRPVRSDRHALQKMNQGVTFFAGEGSAVTAVYPGKVVFSDWLNGYGLLIILDHGHGFMTLYAHNQSLFKSKGTNVLQGEQIATVGHSGGLKQNGLYFEIRQRGKAIPPLDWLS